ncbi:CoA transferase [Nocardia sp. CA2R105]|nr:CoA transferase [Nocardia coffeae]
MPGALSWLRVVDCSEGLAGAYATGILADHGADVIRVEAPGGDRYRELFAVPYAALHRGTRSVELDPQTDSGREELLRLLGSADVFVHSWAPGIPESYGLGYEAVHAAVPHLVYAAITAFGQTGKHHDVAAYDSIVHAIVGTMGEQDGHRDGPIYEAQNFASQGAGYLADLAILAALYRRHIDGAGRYVDTSLYDGALAYLMMTWGEVDGDEATPMSKRGFNRLIVRTFRCQDGEYLGVHTGAIGAWGRAMKVFGLDGRVGIDPNGRDMGIPLTDEEQKIMSTELFDILASKPRDEWARILRDADVCAVEHLRPGEAFDTEQVRYNGTVTTVDDPVLGEVEQVGVMIRLDRTPGEVRGPAPLPGAQTAEVLGEVATAPIVPSSSPVDAAVPLLDGVKVLDVGAYYAGPWSSRVLADLGADVVKLETVQGDSLRGLRQVYRACQAGKRVISADLKDPDLAPLRRALIEWADVIQHNMRPGAAERLGVGVEQVRVIKPDTVYQHGPGWGAGGPDRLRQSFAPLLSGYAGMTFEVAGQFNDPLPPIGNEDPGAGLLGAIGILMALLHRQRTGEGQLVETPQVSAALGHMLHIARRTTDREVLGANRLDPLQLGVSPTDRLYETSDGWVVVAANTDDELSALSAATGVEILGDQRFGTIAGRAENDYELGDLLGTVIHGWTTAEALDRLGAASVPAAEPAPYNNRVFLTDPDNLASRRAAVTEHSDGKVREIGILFRVSDTTFPPHRIAAELGEHTEQIMTWAGYTPEQIVAAEARGSVRSLHRGNTASPA